MGAEGDDATARVYIHRLRKRLERFYEREGKGPAHLVLPAGSYGLVLESSDAEPSAILPAWRNVALGLATGGAARAGAGLRGWGASPARRERRCKAMPYGGRSSILTGRSWSRWATTTCSARSIRSQPEKSRLIRDYTIDSPADLARAQDADPERYAKAEDIGLTYLPILTAYALRAIMPVLTQHAKPVQIMPASQVDSTTLRDFNVVYLGLCQRHGPARGRELHEFRHCRSARHTTTSIDLQTRQTFIQW